MSVSAAVGGSINFVVPRLFDLNVYRKGRLLPPHFTDGTDDKKWSVAVLTSEFAPNVLPKFRLIPQRCCDVDAVSAGDLIKSTSRPRPNDTNINSAFLIVLSEQAVRSCVRRSPAYFRLEMSLDEGTTWPIVYAHDFAIVLEDDANTGATDTATTEERTSPEAAATTSSNKQSTRPANCNYNGRNDDE
jgi:hypothetical protein